MTMAFNLSLAGCIAALVFFSAGLFSKKRLLNILATSLLVVGTAALTTYLIMRWVEAGRAPFSNMFESLVLFAWSIMVVYLVLQIRIKLPAMSVAAAALAAATLAYASAFHASDILPLMPALRSNWLTFHVFTCFMGYGGFAIASLSSIGYLIVTRQGNQSKPETVDAVDTITAKTISFGFLFLTLGIITGAVWANSAWGTYWSWDPKETWSLITWFVYAVFLHCRYMRGWRGKRAAWISIIGFASVIFTYFGVNYVLSGLHSYAK